MKYATASLALAITILASPSVMASTPLGDDGVSLRVGGFTNGYVDSAGGGLGDTYVMYATDFTLRPTDFGLILDGSLFGHTPTNPQGAQTIGGLARVGWGGESFAIAVGAYARYDFIAAGPNVEGVVPNLSPLVVLPSLTLDWRPGAGDLGVHLGILDRTDGGSLARAGVSWGNWGVSYLALTGAEVFGSIPIGDAISIDVRAYGTFILSGSYSAGGSAGVTWGW